MTYKIYRAIFTESIEDINGDNLGQSWAIDYGDASSYANDKKQVAEENEKVAIIEAIVPESAIDFEQTIGQHFSEYANENEVVLRSREDIQYRIVDFDNEDIEGEFKAGNTGHDRARSDETTAQPYNEDHFEWNDDIDEQIEITKNILNEA